MSRFLQNAAPLAAHGWAVLPLHVPVLGGGGCSCGFRDCSSPGKHPRVKTGLTEASSDRATIERWGAIWPEANIGIATGAASGIFVLDLDSEDALAAVVDAVGPLPPTLVSLTGRGLHYFFKDAEGVKNRAALWPHVDVRGTGGYIVAPPSLHASGRLYRWQTPICREIAEAPAALLMAIRGEKRAAPVVAIHRNGAPTSYGLTTYQQAALESAFEAVRSAGTGQRNDTLNREAYALAGLDIPLSQIKSELGFAAVQAGLPQREIDRTLQGALARGAASPRLVEPLAPTSRPRKRAAPREAEPADPDVTDPDIAEMNGKHAVVSVGATVSILRESFDPDLDRLVIEYLSERALELLYKPRRIPLGNKTVSLAAYWLSHPDRRSYERVIFAPGNTDPRYYNLWRGWAVEPQKGDWSLFRAHLLHDFCGGNEDHCGYLLAWLADAVQNPDRRPGVALVLRGKRGTGKGEFWRHLSSLFGTHALQVAAARHLTGNFNSHLQGVLLLNADEAFWAGDKGAEGTLKSLITEPSLNIERKGFDVQRVPNRVRLIMFSNEDWVIPAGPDERRFFVLDVADTHRQDHAYFAAIADQMERQGGREALLYDLQHLDISNLNLRQVPATEALLAQKFLSLTPIARFWLGRLRAGEPVEGRPWSEPVPTAEMHRAYLEETEQTGERRKKVEMEFAAELKKLCPGVTNKKSSIEIVEKIGGYLSRHPARVHCFHFPALARCRESFASYLNSAIEWPPLEETPTTDTNN